MCDTSERHAVAEWEDKKACQLRAQICEALAEHAAPWRREQLAAYVDDGVADFDEALTALVNQGFVAEQGGRYQLTPEGWDFVNGEEEPEGLQALTKAQLIAALADVPDDAPVLVFCGCRALSSVVDVNRNGDCVQLNTDDARALIDQSS